MKRSNLILQRTFSAAPERVFSAWSDPHQLAAWWGPAHFSTRLVDVQVRAGGPFRLDMVGPDGTVYGMFGTFHEVTPPSRIVFSSGALDGAGNPLFEVRHTVAFAPADDGKATTLTLEAIVVREGPGAAAALAGMKVGWCQSLDRLSDLTAADRVISSARFFQAPRARVFAMFTDPSHLAQWWGPAGFRLTTHRADFRSGGEWRFTMHGPDGRDYENHNLVRECEAPERLVFDHVSPPQHRVTIHLYEVMPEVTALHFQLLFSDAALRQQVAREFKAVEGMQQTLDRLEKLLEGSAVRA
ncbi:MAG TPA: SRPBCC family protein [Opitutaceae bacterium]|jgi:uncharacterized protein YndB with AHSA1/START domain|nr:SRPBCC family protein [Opitutaceae bacterium]